MKGRLSLIWLLIAIAVLVNQPHIVQAQSQSIAINAGSSAIGSFRSDVYYNTGATYSTSATINTSGVANPAPSAVYQTERFNWGAFNYTIPGLTSGAPYTVRLHFAEIYHNAAGKRIFNVAINGTTVLSAFDVFAAAGAKNKALVREFSAVANANGQIVIAFTPIVDNPKINGIEIAGGASGAPTSMPTPTQTSTPLPSTATPSNTPTPASTGSGIIALNSGGQTIGSFRSDVYYNTGAMYSTSATIDTSGVANPAPSAVYQTEHFNWGAFNYTIPGLTSGAPYTVRLHFAEIYHNAAGKRIFNVAINGTTVLSAFDVFAAAGAKNKALVREFSAVANANGQIVIALTPIVDNPKINGIEIAGGASGAPMSTSTPTWTSTPTVLPPTATSVSPTNTPLPTNTAVPPTATNTPLPPTATTVPPMPPAATRYPLKVSANKRYLVDQNNQPFLMIGDAAWSLIAQLNNADTDFYLNNRQSKGFNTVLVSLIEHQFATNAPRNIAGDAPFTGAPFTTPNEAYFAHADYVIAGAASRGIMVLLDPLYLGYACGSEGWCAEVKAATTNDLASWGTYVGNRYKNYANIVWVIGGDTDPNGAGIAKVSAFVNALAAADPNHIITAHNGPESMAVSPWSGASWLAVNNFYTYSTVLYQNAQTAYNVAPTLPYFLMETAYENEHGSTAQSLRAQFYWTMMSGGLGQVYGNCPVWSFGVAPSYCNTPSTDWKTALNRAGATNLTVARNLFSGYAWQNLVPDFAHTFLTAGYGANGQTNYATAAVTADGSLAMVYVPTNLTLTVNMSKLRGTTTAQWFDPATGASTAIGTFANSGSRQFTPPGNNAGGAGDWVLVLQAP